MVKLMPVLLFTIVCCNGAEADAEIAASVCALIDDRDGECSDGDPGCVPVVCPSFGCSEGDSDFAWVQASTIEEARALCQSGRRLFWSEFGCSIDDDVAELLVACEVPVRY